MPYLNGECLGISSRLCVKNRSGQGSKWVFVVFVVELEITNCRKEFLLLITLLSCVVFLREICILKSFFNLHRFRSSQIYFKHVRRIDFIKIMAKTEDTRYILFTKIPSFNSKTTKVRGGEYFSTLYNRLK